MDEFARQLATFIRRVMARMDYVGLTPATVLGQTGQLLDLACDAPTPFPRLVDVPIRHGLPGVTAVSVAVGARVHVGFDGGDPRKPFAVLWDAGNATSVTFNGSTKQLARTDDTTADGKLVFTPDGRFVGYVPPGGPDVPTPPGGSAATLTGVVAGSSMIRG